LGDLDEYFHMDGRVLCCGAPCCFSRRPHLPSAPPLGRAALLSFPRDGCHRAADPRGTHKWINSTAVRNSGEIDQRVVLHALRLWTNCSGGRHLILTHYGYSMKLPYCQWVVPFSYSTAQQFVSCLRLKLFLSLIPPSTYHRYALFTGKVAL